MGSLNASLCVIWIQVLCCLRHSFMFKGMENVMRQIWAQWSGWRTSLGLLIGHVCVCVQDELVQFEVLRLEHPLYPNVLSATMNRCRLNILKEILAKSESFVFPNWPINWSIMSLKRWIVPNWCVFTQFVILLMFQQNVGVEKLR